MRHSSFQTILGLLILGMGAMACENKNSSPSQDPASAAFVKGRTIYQTQCMACHHADPHKAGSLGPDVFGSSKELLKARIMHAAYPDGYSPKRTTKIMAPLPHLENEIEALHTFLNQEAH